MYCTVPTDVDGAEVMQVTTQKIYAKKGSRLFILQANARHL